MSVTDAPGIPVAPSANVASMSLDLYNNKTSTFTVSLGMSGDNVTPLATKATASSSNPNVASVTSGDLTTTATVTAHRVGSATIIVTFDNADGTVVPIEVAVVDTTPSQPPAPPTPTPSRDSGSGGGKQDTPVILTPQPVTMEQAQAAYNAALKVATRSNHPQPLYYP